MSSSYVPEILRDGYVYDPACLEADFKCDQEVSCLHGHDKIIIDEQDRNGNCALDVGFLD